MNFFLKTLVAGAISLASAGFAVAGDQIVVATDTNFKPFSYRNEDGNYVGYDVDIWNEIGKRIGVEYELRPMDFNGIIPGIQSGNIDVAVAAMSITSKREEVIDFSYPYYKAGITIMVRADEDGVKELGDLSGKVIATKQGTSTVPFLKENTEAGKVAPKEVKEFPNITDAFLELRAGGADAVMFDLPPLQDYAATVGKDAVKLVGPLYLGHFYGIGMPKGSELRKKINVALLEMQESGKLNELHNKWFGSDSR
ncbi:transporter substrate-binding domain-containing protein [Ollibium composti]|uniref:Transporter substrate-binding domain-containing protein n=1 Tax=Ollibium composti TaxID=2675109 RepID=A0ABY2Q560_9HYPH|nr:transporter substrate-binding domain-containing protein [Mesorhizobium composti]THF56438.1 transporter substrate-binding domain-containing protein [Mesorhizobium composti]